MFSSVCLSGFTWDDSFLCRMTVYSLSKMLVHIGTDLPSFFSQLESGSSIYGSGSVSSIELYSSSEITEYFSTVGIDTFSSRYDSVRLSTLLPLCSSAGIPSLSILFERLHERRVSGESSYTDMIHRTGCRFSVPSDECVSSTVLYSLFLITRITMKDGLHDGYFLDYMRKGWNPRQEMMEKMLFPLGIDIADFMEAIEKEDLVIKPSADFKGRRYDSHRLMGIIWEKFQEDGVSKRGIARITETEPSAIMRVTNTVDIDMKIGTLMKYSAPLSVPLSAVFREYDLIYNCQHEDTV